MYPTICKIGPFTIYSYGLMLAAAFLAGSGLAAAAAKRRQIPPELIFNFCFVCALFGILGGRIFYIMENIHYYLKNPLEMAMFQHGGLSWFGGLFLGGIAGTLYLKKKGQKIYKILDLIAPYLALAQAIGRVGCLLNGCCFGRVSKFGIYFAAHKLILIPAQIYSSLLLIFIFMILRLWQERPHRESQVFFGYLLLYSLKRFFMEFLRWDNEVILFGLTLFQIISIAVFLLALVKLLSLKKNKN